MMSDAAGTPDVGSDIDAMFSALTEAVEAKKAQEQEKDEPEEGKSAPPEDVQSEEEEQESAESETQEEEHSEETEEHDEESEGESEGEYEGAGKDLLVHTIKQLQNQISELKEKVELGEKIELEKKAPKDEKRPAIYKFIDNEDELNETVTDPNRFNAVLSGMYNSVRESVISEVPSLVGVVLEERAKTQAAYHKFFSANPDLFQFEAADPDEAAEMQQERLATFAGVVQKVQEEHPNWTNDPDRIISTAGKRFRIALGIKKGKKSKASKRTAGRKRAPFPKSRTSGRDVSAPGGIDSRKRPKTVAEDIDSMARV